MGLTIKLNTAMSVSNDAMNNAVSNVIDCAGNDSNVIEIADNPNFSEYCGSMVSEENAGTELVLASLLDVIRLLNLECDKPVILNFTDLNNTTSQLQVDRIALLFGEWSDIKLVTTEDATNFRFIAVGSKTT